jgi:hypothetical protein
MDLRKVWRSPKSSAKARTMVSQAPAEREPVDLGTLEEARVQAELLILQVQATSATVVEQAELHRLVAVLGAGVKALSSEDSDADDEAPPYAVFFVKSLEDVVAVIDLSFPANKTTAERKLAVIVDALQGALTSRAAAPPFPTRSSFHKTREGDGRSLVYAAVVLGTAQMTNDTVLHQRQLRGDVALYGAALGRDAVVDLLGAMVIRYAAESRDASARAGRAEATAKKWTPAALDAAFQRAAEAGDGVYACALEDIQCGGAGNARILADAAEVSLSSRWILSRALPLSCVLERFDRSLGPPPPSTLHSTPRKRDSKRARI